MQREISSAALSLDTGKKIRQEGLAWLVNVPAGFGPGDAPEATGASRLILYENDRPLGPPHAHHETIRRVGGGAYSHWQDSLYFSTSDGSDPRTNGRTYRIELAIDDVSYYPPEVYLETINTCNASCPFCPLFQGDSLLDRMHRPATIMPLAVFEKCVRQIAAWPRLPATIYPHGNGEPLQDPHFARRLGLLAEFGLGRLVNLHTNGQFLSDEMARAILGAGVRTISIAFDGATKKVYEAHRVRCDYDRVLRNIENLTRLRREMGARTQIVIVYVRTRDNEHEVAAAYEMFARRLDPELDELHDKLSSDWADDIAEGDFYRLPKNKTRKVSGCSALENQLFICSDGSLAACCIDYNLTVSQGGFGNAADRPLIDLWRGQKRAALRDQLKHGAIDAVPEKCKDCPIIFSEDQVNPRLAKIDPQFTTPGSFEFVYRFPPNSAGR